MDLHYQVYGRSGHPMIILHGLFGSLDNWLGISRRLSARYRVFAVDLRNHGKSPQAPEMTLDLMAGDLEELMSAQGLSTVHVLGHSMGGKVAMNLALNAPGKVHKLIVVDIAPREYPPQHTEILDALLALDLSKYKNRREVEQALAARIADGAVRRFLVKSIMHEPGRPLEWRMDLTSISSNYPRLVQAVRPGCQFSGPTLFIKGANSDYIAPGDESRIRELFPAAVIRTIPGAGHWVHAEAPEVFCHEILDFLG